MKMAVYIYRNYKQPPHLGNNNNPISQKIGDKIVSRNGYSGLNQNGYAVGKRYKTGGDIVDGKNISHI